MSLYTAILQLNPSELPPAVQWLVYVVLLYLAGALLKRSIDKLDKSIERLDTSISSISEKLVRLDEKFDKHEADIKELKENAKSRRR